MKSVTGAVAHAVDDVAQRAAEAASRFGSQTSGLGGA
jgi:hypothetical protein